MHNFLEQLKQAKHAVRFAPERKKAMRDYFVRMTAADVVLRAPRKEYRTFGSFLMRPMPVLAGIMGLVLVGGSTSLASQGALPGEFLYPVKVGVTEKIVEAVQFTPDAQAEYAAELAERRLDEAAKLAEHGTLDDSLEKELAERFTEHTSRARLALATVRTKNAKRADGIAAAFEDAIRSREHDFGDDDTDDELSFAAAAPSLAAPALMVVAVESASGTASSSADSATSSVTSPVSGSWFRAQKTSGQGDGGERGKRVLRTKVRNTLREIREFRNEMENEARELRMRSRSGGSDDVPSGQGEPAKIQGESGQEQKSQSRNEVEQEDN